MSPVYVKMDLDAMINLYVFKTEKYPIDLYVNRDMYKKLKSVDIWDIGTKVPKSKYRGVNILCAGDK